MPVPTKSSNTYLVGFTVTRINMFPSANNLDNMSPFQLLYNRPVNVRRDANLEFGALYEVTSRTSNNSMDPRTTAAIGIAQTPNGTGTCQFLSLGTWTVFSANHFRQLPMTSDTIARLNDHAAADKRTLSKNPVFTYHGNPLSDDPPAVDLPIPPPPPTHTLTTSQIVRPIPPYIPSFDLPADDPYTTTVEDSLSMPPHTKQSRGENRDNLTDDGGRNQHTDFLPRTKTKLCTRPRTGIQTFTSTTCTPHSVRAPYTDTQTSSTVWTPTTKCISRHG